MFTPALIVAPNNLNPRAIGTLAGFASKWRRHTSSKGKSGLASFETTKVKIELASLQLQIQVAKLEQAAAKLKEQDDALFLKIVCSIQKHDSDRARAFASELSLMVNMGSMLTQAKLALEQLVLRLSTVTDLGDLAEATTPSLSAIRQVSPGLARLVPESEREIGNISDLLSSAFAEAEKISHELPLTTSESPNESAEKVIEEAKIVTEHQRKTNCEIPESSDNLEAEAL